MDKNEESGISSLFIQTTEDVANAVATAASATTVRSPRPSVVFSSRDDSGNNQLQKLQRRVISVLKGFSPPPEVKKATYNPEILTSQKRQWANFQLQTLDQRSVKEPSKLFESIVVVGLHPRTDVRALEKHVLERSNEDQKKSRSMLNFHQQVHAEPNFEPQILFVYPPKKKLPLKYKDLLSFCFPGGLEVHAVERTPSLSELNEILLSQEQVKQSDLSFVFRLQVADDSSLYGCCVYIEEIVQKPSGLISMLSEEQGTCFPLSRYIITTPRCYCILSRLPFFDLHFGILRSIFSEERYERLTRGIEMLNLLSSEENYGQDRTDDEPKSTEQSQSSADDRGQVEFSNIDIEAPREKVSGNGNPPVSSEPEEELDSQETLKSGTDLDVGKEAGDVTDGDTEISLQNGHKEPSGETTKRKHFEKQFPVALLPLLQYHQCESPESHMRCGFYSSSEDKNFRCEMDDLELEEPSSSGQEDCTKHDSILEWAKANNHGSLQIICEYYKLQCPTRGSMITFQPLEHLHPLEFQRPAETVLHIAGSTVDLRSQNTSLKLAEAQSALLAEEEASALSVWTVACICGSLRLENVLALFSGALLEKQIVVVCSNLLYTFNFPEETALFGKFLGKSLPLDQVKPALSTLWSGYGSFSVADLPNGFLFIKCNSSDMVDQLLCDGPWTIGGMVLQLAPWRPNFQAAFERLDTAAIWVQFHHLPVEYWHGEMLEHIASQFGRLIKIDDHTLNMSRAKFARLCIEINLSHPLLQGFWIGGEDDKVLVPILYERLPTFCYRCGRIGHSKGDCLFSSGNDQAHDPETSDHIMVPDPPLVEKVSEQVLVHGAQETDGMEIVSESDMEFGSWMVVQHRRGRGRGRGPGAAPRRNQLKQQDDDTWHTEIGNDQPVVSRGGSHAIRGGRGGRRDWSLGDRITVVHPTVEFQRSDHSSSQRNHLAVDDGLGHKALNLTVASLDVTNPQISLTHVVDIDGTDTTAIPIPPSLGHTSSLPLPPPILSSLYPQGEVTTGMMLANPSYGPNPDSHDSLVHRVTTALRSTQETSGPQDLVMDHDVSSASDKSDGGDEEMTLAQYQNETKLEAIARRQSSKQSPSAKKGRKNSSAS